MAPVVIVTIHVPPRRILDVEDWTAAQLGDGVFIQVGNVFYGIHVGAQNDFVPGPTDRETAEIIAETWNDLWADDAGIRAIAVGEQVHFIAAAAIHSFNIASSNRLAFVERIAPAPTAYSFVSGHDELFGYTPTIATISPVGFEIDALTREFTVGSMDVVFGDDGVELRRLVRFYAIFGRAVDIRIGTPELDESDFVALPRMYIEDIVPRRGSILLKLTDAAGNSFRDVRITGAWVAKHPLEVIIDILARAGVTGPNNPYVDLTTLDYTQYPAISHWVVSRYDDQFFGLQNHVTEPTRAIDLVRELVVMLGGTFMPGPDGRYRFKLYDQFAAPVRSWSAGPPDSDNPGHDVDEIDQTGAFADMVNEIIVNFGQSNTSGWQTFEYSDDNSIREFDRRSKMVLEAPWTNGVTRIGTMVDNPSGQSFYIEPDCRSFAIQYVGRQGFCGAKWDRVGNQFVLAPGMTMGANTGRLSFVRIQGLGIDINGVQSPNVWNEEIVAIDRWSLRDHFVDAPNVGVVPWQHGVIAHIATWFTNNRLGFVGGRRGLGSDPVHLWNLQDPGYQFVDSVVDVTIPAAMAISRLERLSRGVPRVRARTTLEHLDLEVADFVSPVGDDIFCGHLMDGTGEKAVFEITRGEVMPFEDSPGIDWELTWVRNEF